MLDGVAGPLGAWRRGAAYAAVAAATASLVALGHSAPVAGAFGGVTAVTVATVLLGPVGGGAATLSAAAMGRLYLGWSWIDVAILITAATAEILWIALALCRGDAATARAAVAERDARALQSSAARFKGLLEGAPDAVVISSADGRIVLLNAEAERLFGYRREDLFGQSLEILMPHRFRGRHAGHVSSYLARPTTRRMGDGSNMFGRRRDGTEFPIETNLSLLSDNGEGLVTSVIRDLTPRREVQEREALLIRELNHRVKNTLASVQSIVAQTVRSAQSPEAFNEAVLARVMALSQSHDVLTRNDWTGAKVADVVAEQLNPYTRGAPFALTGPAVVLRPNRAVTLGMAVGELATNAAKYGALSNNGAVSVSWSISGPLAAPTLHLIWVERGGPPVAPPSREGFGTRLLKRSLAAGLHGSAELDYAVEGLTATLAFPLLEGEV